MNVFVRKLDVKLLNRFVREILAFMRFGGVLQMRW